MELKNDMAATILMRLKKDHNSQRAFPSVDAREMLAFPDCPYEIVPALGRASAAPLPPAKPEGETLGQPTELSYDPNDPLADVEPVDQFEDTDTNE